jgi:Uma2 family endonuclease
MADRPSGVDVETLQRIPMSYEEYLALPPYPRNEWVDGVVVLTATAPSFRHQRACRRLANLLEDALPGVFAEEALGVKLPRNRIRVPDVVVIENEPTEHLIVEAPLLVAEVLSPSTRREDLLRKAPEYAEGGIDQYWVVDPEAWTIEVLERSGKGWESLAVFDSQRPRGEVTVGDHGVVAVDVESILGARP